MKKLIYLVVAAVLMYSFVHEQGVPDPFPSPSNAVSSSLQSDVSDLAAAYQNQQSNLQVYGDGVVSRVLADDLDGSRHQRFILTLSTGQTLLVAHNIDLAPRVSGLTIGDTVAFYGVYEWNDKGGVIHWTHHDPNGRHVAGWLKHGGNTYQ
jgi:hypothetical protein